MRRNSAGVDNLTNVSDGMFVWRSYGGDWGEPIGSSTHVGNSARCRSSKQTIFDITERMELRRSVTALAAAALCHEVKEGAALER